MKYLGNGKVVSEIERNLRLADGVLKYQTVLVRSDIEAEGLTITEEDVKFERLELPPIEDDREDLTATFERPRLPLGEERVVRRRKLGERPRLERRG